MHITDIPYNKCTLLLTICKDMNIKPIKDAFKHLFANCQLLDALLLQNALKCHNISSDDFYVLLKYKSINVHHISIYCTQFLTTA